MPAIIWSMQPADADGAATGLVWRRGTSCGAAPGRKVAPLRWSSDAGTPDTVCLPRAGSMSLYRTGAGASEVHGRSDGTLASLLFGMMGIVGTNQRRHYMSFDAIGFTISC